MCDSHHHDPTPPTARQLAPTSGRARPSRRRFVQGLAAAAGAAAWATPSRRLTARAYAEAASTPVSMAMHVHASFSEGGASIASQLDCARQSGVDVVWFTEHDWRMAHYMYRTQVSFDSLKSEKEFGKGWTWQAKRAGRPVATSGDIVTNPVSPNDPSHIPGALRATVTASTSSTGDSYLWYAQCDPSRHNHNGNIAGLTISLDVMPLITSTDGFGELRLQLSNHPASGGRAAGGYVLSYRFGTPGERRADGFLGIIPFETPQGTWTTVTLDPVADIEALWPDLVAIDNAWHGTWLGATARSSAQSDFVFDNLQMHRPPPADLSPFDVQRSILASYQELYSDITALCGQEISFLPEHMNWFGGDDYLIPYHGRSLTSAVDSAATNGRGRALAARGGALSINHPYGASEEAKTKTPTLAEVAGRYLKYGAYGATMLEVAYAKRGGATIDQHLSLWDVMSRNAVYLTGTGVNDNHDGLDAKQRPWDNDLNRFTTSVWSPSLGQADLLGELASGRVFTSEVTSRGLALDLHADGAPMGSVSVRPDLDARDLTIDAGGLPAGSTVSLIQGAVDYAGSGGLSSNTVTVATVADTELGGGSAVRTVDTTSSSFVRATVKDGDGRTIAVSNPIWLLREASQTPVPDRRRALDSVV